MNDLTILPADLGRLAEQIQAAHTACEEAVTEGLRHAVEAGRLLLRAKEQLPHRHWLPWLQANCRIPQRLAQRYMQVAKAIPRLLDAAQTTRVSDLSLGGALKLLRRSRQTEARARYGTTPVPTAAAALVAANDATVPDGSQDALGNPVTDVLRPVFGDLFLPESIRQIQRMQARFAECSGRFAYLCLEEAVERAERLIATIQDAVPFVVHQACAGAGCAECKNAGYLTKRRYEELRR